MFWVLKRIGFGWVIIEKLWGKELYTPPYLDLCIIKDHKFPEICFKDEEEDQANLVEDDSRRQQLMAQEQVIDDDLDLIREREEQIRALEVRKRYIWKPLSLHFNLFPHIDAF